jgi:two-component system LytT family response regulator
MQMRALIVDDEPLARRRLRAFLRTEADVEIVGECGNGEEAGRAVRELKPHLMFLDVQMPGVDGFGVLRSLDARETPLVIFVTAHDQYAVRAFEERALDYLLKPFARKRFQEAVARARERIGGGRSSGYGERVQELLGAVAPRRLAIKTGARTVVLDAARIEWLEAEGDYVRVHAGRDAHLTRQTMNRFEMQLAGWRFVRVHRSAIVNLDCIQEIHPLAGGEHVLALRSGARVTLSRGYRERLERALGQEL